MRRQGLWTSIYWLLQAIQLIAVFGTAAFAFSQKANPSQYWPWVANRVMWMQSATGIMGPILAGVIALTEFAKRQIGAPWVWDTIQTVLDKFKDEVFNCQPDDQSHHNRVTLFKRTGFLFWLWPWRKWYWPWGKGRGPWSGWLIAVVRSGHATQRSASLFLAPDDADHAEGVAGMTFNRNGIVHISGLPLLNAHSPDLEVEHYARQTLVPKEWILNRIRQGKPCARSLCGLVVEVKGRKWGVMVLDSREPDRLKNANEIEAKYRLVVSVLTKLLERV